MTTNIQPGQADGFELPSRLLRILHIEDNDHDAELVTALLEEDGLEIDIHRVLKPEAIETAMREAGWDIILADYSLPAYDGFAALQLRNEKLADVPFVFFAGTMGEDFAIDCLRKGATDYVLKERPQRLPASVRRAMKEFAERRERRQVESALQISESRFRALYDNNPSMFFTLSMNDDILSVNEYAAFQLGFAKADLIGQPFTHLLHPEDSAIATQALQVACDSPDIVQRCEIRMRRVAGDFFWVRETLRVVDDYENAAAALVVCEDITEARQLSEELSYQATHDMLTGLANRREFERLLSRSIDLCRHSKTEHVLLYLDLDQFKVVNDTCGHIAGDELLRQLGDMLSQKVRRGDTIARLGGDEFGVLVEHCAQEQGIKVAEMLRREVEEFRFSWDDKMFTLGMSIGLVSIDEHSTNVPEIMSAADTACYAAKDGGRNRIQVYYDSDLEMSRRRSEMQWVSRINQALEENRFYLVAQQIQPITRTEDDGAHVELLIRMRGDGEDTIMPDAFLPAAERYNLSHLIDYWVVTHALDWLTETPRLIDHVALCCINLSAASLARDDLLNLIENAISDSSVPAASICFEITETSAISNFASAQRFIKTLGDLGCRFALDDFGTGMSSFAYLKNLPVDYLKIDGSFVRDITRDKIDRAMVRSIHDIGHVMGKLTIAEFVEDDETLAQLRQLGVDYAQGYGLHRPEVIDDWARKLLRQ